MGRPAIQVTTLHGYTMEELIELKNSTESKYMRLVLTTITMFYPALSMVSIAV